MPIRRSSDSKGPYYQFGPTGKKYHYQANNAKSREAAKARALSQARAIKASQSRRAKKQ